MIRPGESSADTLLNHRGIQRVPSDRIELFQLREFIDGDLRTELIRLIEQDRRPST
ncbi:MAG TPA: oxygenase, partial [Erythrobacter sp.]|nr:oxygenase [Erythrobacter sp.]